MTSTIFRPPGSGPIWVMAVEDLDVAERLLRPIAGARLCLVASRYRREEVQRALTTMQENFWRWRAFRSGQTATHDGQVLLSLQVVRLLPEAAHWTADLPDGLLDVVPWLTPIHADTGTAQTRSAKVERYGRWLTETLIGALCP